QSASFKIKEQNPVVNEGNPLTLNAVDAAGQPVSGVTFESTSTDVGGIDSPSGTIRGFQRGYATVTARKGNESFSFFVTVARVSSSGGAKVPGDQKVDTSGAVYFSDPINHVILKKDGPASDVK